MVDVMGVVIGRRRNHHLAPHPDTGLNSELLIGAIGVMKKQSDTKAAAISKVLG